MCRQLAQRRYPTTYIPDEAQRYRPPPEVRSLVEFSLLKSVAEAAGVESIDKRQGVVNIKFHQQSKVDPFRLMAMVRKTAGAQFTPAGVLKLPMEGVQGMEFLGELRRVLGELRVELPEEKKPEMVGKK